ncbi:class IV adenylate cyclase [Candidatus Pacearchaeota archaeon]|nr:class IV adenylate cyclase [Candidatus Pacearchaeota archaeon]
MNKIVWLEVETKVRIKNVNSLRKKIKKIARFQKKETRGDDYFALHRRFRKYAYPKKAFRIRRKPDKFEVNFKKHLKKYWDSEIVVKQEFEFVLKDQKDVDNLLALFFDLGFVQWMKKRKTSESYLHKKDKRIIIEINHVAHLGYFMEIEYLAQPSEMKKAKKKIHDTLRELEIDPKDVDNTGYTKRLHDKGIKDKRYWVK